MPLAPVNTTSGGGFVERYRAPDAESAGGTSDDADSSGAEVHW